ncbi:endonuclease/exonuclease/phosphatase family protein [Trichophyton benhamiae CBS 112371]|uniref:Endonuclease/exonuclease/phosphatase family protein n=1 Tax=Arthroderma benhamiae (strain ATCC MYA-4681 / CBS 112371) TaxID=663331 RepID=D4AJS6_ARTBC|nr:endonuclease/exonuclease/phosphatase family protein [Trichophyton benhamiae CBS 112371]EFE36999.1 endonuclease/exonuclease/phosphatase family protein [Trichophyton benhamiae CBS 112371]
MGVAKDGRKETKSLRACNTHLDSLSSAHPIRPYQVAKATNYPEEEVIHGGVLAGNMNSIQASDDRIAGDNNLKDAYLVLGGTERDSKGYTWGYQQRPSNKHEIFWPKRLDKVRYRGGLVAGALTFIGVGVIVKGDEIRSSMRARGMGHWATDDYGLLADLEVAEVVEVEEEKKD